ncbi:hypothetical protein AgCh_004095 [Apium graveolens]
MEVVHALPVPSSKCIRVGVRGGDSKNLVVSSSSSQVESHFCHVVTSFLEDEELAFWKSLSPDERDRSKVRDVVHMLFHSLEDAFEAPNDRARLKSLEVERNFFIARPTPSEEKLEKKIKVNDAVIMGHLKELKRQRRLLLIYMIPWTRPLPRCVSFRISCYRYQGDVGNEQTIPNPQAEWTDEDIEKIHKDKKAMNIMFNGLDGDMFDNFINCKTAKEIWDTIQIICDGTEQVRENKIQLLIQHYEHFHCEESESLSDIFSRFQKLLNALKLHGRIYQTKDSNLKFLRSRPKEWKPMTVSLKNSQDYKEFTLERLYDILKTYELEMEQDEQIDKGRKKEKAFLTQDNDWAVDGVDEDEETSYVNLDLMAKLDEAEVSSSRNQEELIESLKKEEILRKQLEREHEVIKAWKSSRDVHTQIIKVQGIESFCEEAWKKSKEKPDPSLEEGLSMDVDSMDNEDYPSKDKRIYSWKDRKPHSSSNRKPVSKVKLAKLKKIWISFQELFYRRNKSNQGE